EIESHSRGRGFDSSRLHLRFRWDSALTRDASGARSSVSLAGGGSLAVVAFRLPVVRLFRSDGFLVARGPNAVICGLGSARCRTTPIRTFRRPSHLKKLAGHR